MQLKILKYILDLESILNEIENVKLRSENNFLNFKEDIILQRAIERDLEIIGEAVKKIIEINSSISIVNSKKIIGLRNLTYNMFRYEQVVRLNLKYC